MNVTQITSNRFHHFHLARQLEKHGRLNKIYCGYPKFMLKDEKGIPLNKIATFPWFRTPFMLRGKLGLDKFDNLNKEWEWIDKQSLDKHVASQIISPSILIALSGHGLMSGTKMKAIGGKFICDRGSGHIQFQNDIYEEEYRIWGLKYKGIDNRIIDKEIAEYSTADVITVPSEFAKQSFIAKGVAHDKIVKIPYGARLDRFKQNGMPCEDKFTILWVGGVSIPKGFMYALKAFQAFKHPKKEFIVIGSISSEIKELINKENLSNVVFYGNVPNADLVNFYSTSHVFVISSIQEGLAMVQGESLACGCPVIASENTGGMDLFSDGVEGFIVPIRSDTAILEKFNQLAEDNLLRRTMSQNALDKVKEIGGWDNYGLEMINLINELK